MPDPAAVSSSERPIAGPKASRAPQVESKTAPSKPKGVYVRFGKRWCDLVVSLLGIILCAPALVIIAIIVKLSSPGPVIFRQVRIGKSGTQFEILKFRTMVDGAERMGHGITSEGDIRITPVGVFLRRWKLDELPQLWNVLVGQMSLVGPRPELPTYVAAYSELQQTVLKVRPGITDDASIRYRDEGHLLRQSANPEQYYCEQVLPDKLLLNLHYVNNISLERDARLLVETVKSVFSTAKKVGTPTRD